MFNYYVKKLNNLINSTSFFAKIDSITIVSTFFALWLAVFFDETVENGLAYFLILTFGILHGANDLKLIQRSYQASKERFHFFKILSSYILVVLAGILLFYFIPSLAFLAFLLVSGYHFGEQHWILKFRVVTFWSIVFFSSYGLFLLFLLFYVNAYEVSAVIFKITGHYFTENHFALVTGVSGVLTIVSYLLLWARKDVKTNVLKQLFFLLVFFIVFNSASLLWSFAIYFVLWHSIPSMAQQVLYLYGSPTRQSMLKYIKSSFLYWLFAALTSAILLYFFREKTDTALSFFIAFLAAITFPHVFVINRLNHH